MPQLEKKPAFSNEDPAGPNIDKIIQIKNIFKKLITVESKIKFEGHKKRILKADYEKYLKCFIG